MRRSFIKGAAASAAYAPPDDADYADASSPSRESMLRQALDRIDLLERKHDGLRALMDCKIEALRHDIDTLKEENVALKWSIRQLASRVQLDWEYQEGDSIQPDEYWQGKGFDDDYITNVDSYCIKRVVSAVSHLEHGVCDTITIGRPNGGVVVLDDDALAPHWTMLSQAFWHINPHGKGVSIFFNCIQMSEGVMREICRRLCHRNINGITFHNNHFANMRDAIDQLDAALKSSKVKSLEWSANPIESPDDMALFTQLLSHRKTILDKLYFSQNSHENTWMILNGVDLKAFKLLSFSENNLQTNGREDILPDLIAANSQLESLDLSSNRLGDNDAILIGNALRVNTRLKKLILTKNNNIQERGMSALLRAVNDTSTLNTLSDSNHSCHFPGIFMYGLGLINSRGQMNRIYKLFRLMVDRYRFGEGNVQCLNEEMKDEESVLLAPYIMESIYRRHKVIIESKYQMRTHFCLGIFYELVKDWRLPELLVFREREPS